MHPAQGKVHASTGKNQGRTCIIVLAASRGSSRMRQDAAAADAAAVCTPSGKLRVASYSAITLSMPALAAVSPKRHKGPCSGADDSSGYMVMLPDMQSDCSAC